MSQNSDQPDSNGKQVAFRMTLVAVVGQVGCLTLVILLLALISGLWLDNRLGTRPMFTVGLILVSIPITLIAMIGVTRSAISRLQPASTQKSTPAQKEETIRE